MTKINLGCGRLIRAGWVNVDVAPLYGVDVVCDLATIPWPFEAGSATEIQAKDVVEHLDDLTSIMREIHRVLAPGGHVKIRVPHFTSKDAYGDPTHVRTFSTQTFEYFAASHDRAYYSDFAFTGVERCVLEFDCRWGYPWNFLMQRLVNRSRKTMNFYEGSPFRSFPASNMTVVLRK